MGPLALILSEILYKNCLWEEYCGKNIMGRIMDFWEEYDGKNYGLLKTWEEYCGKNFVGRISWEE